MSIGIILDIIKEFSHQTELTQMSVILTIVIVITGILKLLKQPIVIGYLLAGIVVGPFFLGLVEHNDHSFIELFAHLGIALLLFIVGLWLNPKVIKEHGKTALGVGVIQIIGTLILGLILSLFLWFDWVSSLYIAAWLTFSSTIVIVKLLSDKEEQETLYGKISLGVLIVQDIVVMLLLMGISLSGNIGTDGLGTMLGWGLLLILWVVIVSKFLIPKMMTALAWMKEFLLLIGIGWCLLLWALFQYVGFSFEIGSLIAGMSFALSPYRREIANKLISLRDFFLVLFFIGIGMQLQFGAITEYIWVIIILTVFVLFVKPLLVWVMMKRYGFTNKTSLKSGMSLGQISEFSFLLIGIGISLGHIKDPSLMSVMMFVGLLTIMFSSYMTIYNAKIYQRWRKAFGEDPLDHVHEAREIYEMSSVDVLLFWYGRMWSHLAEVLEKNNLSYMVVDHNPEVITILKSKNIPHVFGDATNEDLYKEVLKHGVKMVISTVRDEDDDWLIISQTKQVNDKTIVIVVSNHIDEALELYDHGADYVVMPDYISAHHTWLMLEEIGFDIDQIINKKTDHILMMMRKRQMGLKSLDKE